MSEIKMVALDLDGTTLNKEEKLTQRVINTCQEATEQGIHIVISTGRNLHAVPHEVLEMKGIEYIITSNGAHITRLATGETVYGDYLEPESVQNIVNAIKKYDLHVECVINEVSYMEAATFYDIIENGSDFRDAVYVKNTRTPIPDICEHMLSNRNIIENVNFVFRDLDKREKMKSILGSIPDTTLTTSFERNLEIGGPDTSKAKALRFLMNMLDVERDELMACGDSPNDMEMIKFAGLGVVVANASDEMKELADYVTASNDEDGVAKAIEKFVLKR